MNEAFVELLKQHKIQGAIFDVDGVILDSMMVWDNAGELFLNSKGIKAEENLSQILFDMSIVQGAEYLKKNYHLEETIEDIQDGINQVIYESYRKTIQLKKGVLEIIKELNQRKILMTIATSSYRNVVEAAFYRLGIMDYFEYIFTCTECGTSKKEPLIFQKACEKMGTDCGRTLVFEDSCKAAETAHRAGFKVVGVYDYSSKSQQSKLKQLSDYYFNTF